MKGMQKHRNVNRLELIKHCALGPTFPIPLAWKCETELTKEPATKRHRHQDHFSVISFFFFRIQAYTVIYAHYIHNYILISAYKSYVKIIFFPKYTNFLFRQFKTFVITDFFFLIYFRLKKYYQSSITLNTVCKKIHHPRYFVFYCMV